MGHVDVSFFMKVFLWKHCSSPCTLANRSLLIPASLWPGEIQPRSVGCLSSAMALIASAIIST